MAAVRTADGASWDTKYMSIRTIINVISTTWSALAELNLEQLVQFDARISRSILFEIHGRP